MSAIFICNQCGSNQSEELSTDQIKCSHCGTEYKKRSDDPTVSIGKGAQITVSSSAHLEIRGNLEIQEGANLEIEGQVLIQDDEEEREE